MPITAEVPGTGFAQVTFAARIGDGPWRPVGTDDAPNGRTFRVFHDLRDVPAGMPLAYKAIVKDAAGAVASAAADATAGPEPAPSSPARRTATGWWCTTSAPTTTAGACTCGATRSPTARPRTGRARAGGTVWTPSARTGGFR
ncbi:hypothetical protein ACFQQB_52675 [Nonomuraea rubra]|uniref:hypothetical protein n=1 Tax=Nonomuraea rubra TaxID=46180 RepID=UPI0036098200